MSLQNPMDLAGPNKTGNWVEPNTANPTVNANVASYAVGADPLKLGNAAREVYVQPGTGAPEVPVDSSGNPLGYPAFPIGPKT